MIKFKKMLPQAATVRKEQKQIKAFKPKEARKIQEWIDQKQWLLDQSLQQAADQA